MPTLFISYRRDDKVAVNKIKDRLKKDFYFEVWIDAESISGGEDWRQEIRKGIDKCDCMLLMLTPDACASVQVKEEVDYAKSIGRRIIPLQLKKVKEPDDLMKLGIEHLNYIDFLADERAGWEKLLTDLPPVLARDRRRLDPTFNKLHTDYLRTLFARYDRVNLTYLLDAAPKEAVSLFDVYVPLKLGVSFNLEVQNGEMVDWWLRDQDAPLQDKEEIAGQTPKSLNGFTPQGTGLAAWVEKLKTSWETYKTNYEQEQAKKEEKDRQPLEDGTYYWIRIESEVAPALNPHLVITGDPGSGKSTLLKHLALCMAGDMLHEGEESQADLNRLGFWPLPAYTPVFIELRTLVSSAFPNTGDEITLEKFFVYLHEQLKRSELASYLEALKDQMRDGDVMLFLDGLDEVPQAGDPNRREQIKTLARLLQKTYPKCRMVITSRPYAYAGDWKLDDFGQVNLASLDEDRLEELALRLFRVVLGQEGAEQEAPQFKDRMQAVPEALRRSPLFFTLMASIWLNHQTKPTAERLPVTKGAIYRECVEMLLRRWTRKDLRTGQSVADAIGLGDEQLRQVLESIAFQVHSEHGGQDDEAVFDGGVVYNIVRGLGIKGFDIDLLLDTLGQRAGVIFEKAPNHYQFAHRSFQEYLSASYLSRHDFPARFIGCFSANPTLWQEVGGLLPEGLQRDDHWQLLRALLPDKKAALPDNTLWAKVLYAARLYFDHLRSVQDDLCEVYEARFVPLLTRLVELGALSPIERAEAGRYLGLLGDPRPGVGVKDGIPDIVWCEIPGGPFLFGSNREKDQRAQSYEPDQHEVTLPAFRIAKYPVTYAQYEAFVEDKGYEKQAYWTEAGWQWKGDKLHPEAYWNDPEWHLSNHPVVGVTWYEAVAFCRWLSEKLGEEVRLPTEAEFEKAARGNTDWIYPYGDKFDANKGNTYETGLKRTSAVGIFPDGASPYGVLEMSGNVWEWSLLPWAAPYEPHTAAQVEVEGAARRVLRGGAWGNGRGDPRVSSRGSGNPGSRNYYVGFRAVSAPLYR